MGKAHYDCDDMTRKASQLASKGNEIQNAFKAIYDKVESMKDGDAWTGGTYDQFVDTVNIATGKLNNIIKSVVSSLPHDIAMNAKATAETGMATAGVSYQDQQPIELRSLSKTNKGAVWDFDPELTKASQEAIKSKFKEVKSFMSDCQNTAEQLIESMRSTNGEGKVRDLISAYKQLDIVIEQLSTALDSSVQTQTDAFNMHETLMATKDKIVEAGKDTLDDAVDALNKAADKGKQTLSDIKSYFIY